MKIIPVALFFLSFFASLVSNAILRQIATKKQILLDTPDEKRKIHQVPTPLTGGAGISIGIIFSAFFLFLFTNPSINNEIGPENLYGNDQNLLNSKIIFYEDIFDDSIETIEKTRIRIEESNSIIVKKVEGSITFEDFLNDNEIIQQEQKLKVFNTELMFLLSQNKNINKDRDQNNLFGNDQNLLDSSSLSSIASNEKTMRISEILKDNLEKNNSVLLQKINNQSIAAINSRGEVKIYSVGHRLDSQLEISNILQDALSQRGEISLNNFNIGLIIFTLIVQLVLIIDDLWGIKVLTRILLQSLSVLGLILVSDVYISSLGNLISSSEILLGPHIGIPFTVFCIVGMMNAFNMIDGLNGLCASLCLTCFIFIIYMINADSVPSLFPLILPVGAIFGFLMYNLGILGNKRMVFLGDNGSNALGFLCAWILVYFCSKNDSNFAPITALWLVAIPFIDAVTVMLLRLKNGKNPFKSGRDHIHHIMIDHGFSETKTFILLILSSIIFAFVGVFLNRYFPVDHFYSFYTFLFLWVCYYLFTRKFLSYV